MTQFVEINGNLYRVGRTTNWSMTGFEEKSKNVKKSQIDFLKSCPFCGRNAVLYASRPSQWIVQCMNLRCRCRLTAHYKEEVIKMWNGRVNE